MDPRCQTSQLQLDFDLHQGNISCKDGYNKGQKRKTEQQQQIWFVKSADLTMWSRSVVSNFCDPMNCNLPGSSVHGILQARILQWVAISFSRGSSWPRDGTRVSSMAGRRFTIWAPREAQTSMGPGKLCKQMSESCDLLNTHRPRGGNSSPAQPGLTMQEGESVFQEEWKFWIFRWNLWILQIGN